MPYGSFEQNKKIKALGMAMTALDQAVRDLSSQQVVIQPKMLERYSYALNFIERARRGASFSANELASLERGIEANLARLPSVLRDAPGRVTTRRS
jgi:hypothetical protein